MPETMTKYSVEDFVNSTGQKATGGSFFELESQRILAVNLNDNLAWTKRGAMIAYTGDVKFEMEDLFEHGIKTVIKRFVTQESGNLVKAKGTGRVYISDCGKKISVINMKDDVLIANGTAVLAFEPTIKWDIKLQKLTSMMAGGLTNIRLEGTGMVAISTAYDPLTLKVTPGNPVYTDPTATIAWSGGLEPTMKADFNVKSLVGRGSGDMVQMKFEGNGFVIVQPDCVNYGPAVPVG